MTKIFKEDEDEWTVWNKETDKVVSIVKGSESFMGDISCFYRVDMDGVTQETKIDNFQTAKSVAYKLVK